MGQCYQLDSHGQATEIALETAFPCLTWNRAVVTLVGGGGKTTLLFQLAQAFANRGRKTLVTTTTHIWQPPGDMWAPTSQAVQGRWQSNQYAVVGTPTPEGKLTALPQAELERYLALADVVLVEGDGAKMRPCKFPAPYEPVILPQSQVVIAVVGLSAVGQPIEIGCFRSQLVADFLGKTPQDVLTISDCAALVASPLGGRKDVGDRIFYPVANQWDDGDPNGVALLQRWKELGIDTGVLTRFDKEERLWQK